MTDEDARMGGGGGGAPAGRVEDDFLVLDRTRNLWEEDPGPEGDLPAAVDGGRVRLDRLRPGTTVANAEVVWPGGAAIAVGITLLGCRHLPGTGGNKGGKYPGYINMGHGREPPDTNLRVLGGEFRGFGQGVLETKGVKGLIQGVKGAWNLRVRWGHHVTVLGCPELGAFTLRGHEHSVIGCPKAKGTLWAGPLPARFEDWKPRHKAGGGQNWECCDDSYVQGVRSVEVGTPSGDGKGDMARFPASRNVIHPGLQARTRLLRQKGTRFAEMAPAALAGLLAS
jgi:hypothetical protein